MDSLWLLCGLMYGLGVTVPSLIFSNFAHQVCMLCCCWRACQSVTCVRCSCRSCTWLAGRAVHSSLV